jgi:signal peptidase II
MPAKMAMLCAMSAKVPAWLSIPFIVIADQLSKALIFAWLVNASSPLSAWRAAEAGIYVAPVQITPFFNIVTVWNTGISFGMLDDTGYNLTYLLIGVALAITFGLGIWLWREQGRLAMAALALVIGGALGNLVDRVRLGAVFDFLDFHVAGYHWPAFNLADSCVVIGVALLVIDSIVLRSTTS